jgi:hypothetical protein
LRVGGAEAIFVVPHDFFWFFYPKKKKIRRQTKIPEKRSLLPTNE